MPEECRKWHSGRSSIVGCQPFERNATGRKGLHNFKDMSAPAIVLHYMTPIWEKAVGCTNRRITEPNIPMQHITVRELKVLHGLRALMALLIKLPQTRTYWEPTHISIFN